MSTIRERLDKLIQAQGTSHIVFKKASTSTHRRIVLEANTVAKAERVKVDEDSALQDALSNDIIEAWDTSLGKYVVTATPENLWSRVVHTIIDQYDRWSSRSAATKRKTVRFIQDIKIDDKFLPNYLIQVFLKIKSPEYVDASREERAVMFEQFDTLRRTYGKR